VQRQPEPQSLRLPSGISPGRKSRLLSGQFSSIQLHDWVDHRLHSTCLKQLGKSDQAFQMAFLFTAGTRTKMIPASETAKPTIEVTIRAPTLAVRCNPKSTNNHPPRT